MLNAISLLITLWHIGVLEKEEPAVPFAHILGLLPTAVTAASAAYSQRPSSGGVLADFAELGCRATRPDELLRGALLIVQGLFCTHAADPSGRCRLSGLVVMPACQHARMHNLHSVSTYQPYIMRRTIYCNLIFLHTFLYMWISTVSATQSATHLYMWVSISFPSATLVYIWVSSLPCS